VARALLRRHRAENERTHDGENDDETHGVRMLKARATETSEFQPVFAIDVRVFARAIARLAGRDQVCNGRRVSVVSRRNVSDVALA